MASEKIIEEDEKREVPPQEAQTEESRDRSNPRREECPTGRKLSSEVTLGCYVGQFRSVSDLHMYLSLQRSSRSHSLMLLPPPSLSQ